MRPVVDSPDFPPAGIPEPPPPFRNRSVYIPDEAGERAAASGWPVRLAITKAGIYDHAFGHVVSNRVNDDHVMVYCISGRGRFALHAPDQGFSIGPGDLFVAESGSCHSYSADPEDPWTILWVHFQGEHASDMLHAARMTPESPVCRFGDAQKPILLFHELFETLEGGFSPGALTYAATCLIQVFAHVGRSVGTDGKSTRFDPEIARAIVYMRENLHRMPKLAEMAAHLNLSVWHFSRRFSEATGFSPIDHFIRLKMQRACELLDAAQEPIKNVSAALGYENPYFFSATFKRVFGISPTQYRKIQKG